MISSPISVQCRFQNEHEKLWPLVFAEATVPKASIKVISSDKCPKYWHTTDCIEIHLPSHDFAEFKAFLEQPQFAGVLPDPMSRWQGILIHEMIHEYQHKVKWGASSASSALAKQYNHLLHFDPATGHGDDFFQGVIVVADRLGCAPTELADRL